MTIVSEANQYFIKKKIAHTSQRKRKMSSGASLDVVPTRASLLLNSAPKEIKPVVYESYKAKPRSGPRKPNTNAAAKSADNELDMKRVRQEVFNFGISGYGFEDQQRAKIALAVKLGAKPPKNAYTNYKDLIEEKKNSKAKAAEEAYIRTVGKNSSGRATVSCNKLTNRFTKQKRRAKDVSDITAHYGVVNPKIHKKKKKK